MKTWRRVALGSAPFLVLELLDARVAVNTITARAAMTLPQTRRRRAIAERADMTDANAENEVYTHHAVQ